MLRTNWPDENIEVRTYTSLTGDFVKLGTTTEYPFVPGGTGGYGQPANWGIYFGNGGAVGDVSFTTANGRLSIGNVGADIHASKWYGIQRDFTIPANKPIIIRCQCRTTDGRSKTIRYMAWAKPASYSWNFASQIWSYDDWEQIALYVYATADTTIRVVLYAAPYTSIPTVATTDQYWGIQFQNFQITQLEASYPAPTWKELTCDTKQFTSHYGRDKFNQRYTVGTAQITLDNSTGEYTYGNPANDGLRPGRFVKSTMMIPPNTAVLRPLFYGIIDAIDERFDIDGKPVVVLNCIDVSSLLSNYNVSTFGSRETLYSSTGRFRNMLDQVGWNSAFYGASYPSSFNLQTIAANGRTVRDELGLIADSEGGYFFTTRDGIVQYYGRNWKANNSKLTTVQAELLATPTRDIPLIDGIPTVTNPAIVELRQLGTDWSRDRTVNSLQLANQNGTARNYNDFPSQTKYGPFTYQRLDFLLDESRPDWLDTRASDFLTGYTDPILRVNSVSFRPDIGAFVWAATVWLEDLVRVRYQNPQLGWGYAVVSHVQGFTNTITPSTWEMSVNLDHPESFVWTQYVDGGWDVAKWDIGLWDEWGDEAGYWDSGELWGDDMAYLTPSMAAAISPDFGTLPNQFVVVARVDGPIDTVGAARMIAAQWENDPGSSWYIRRFGNTGYLGAAFTATGNNANAVAINVSTTMTVTGTVQQIAIAVTLDNGANQIAATGKVVNASGVWADGTSTTIPKVVPLDSPTQFRIGQKGTSTTDQWDGKIYSVEMRTGLDPTGGTVIWRFDPNECPAGATQWDDPRGRHWALTNANPNAITRVPNPGPVAIWGE